MFFLFIYPHFLIHQSASFLQLNTFNECNTVAGVEMSLLFHVFFPSLSRTSLRCRTSFPSSPPLPSPFSLSPSPFPYTSLPLFSLALKSSQSASSPSFTASTCWQEEKEEDAALYPRCVPATPAASTRCL